MGQPLTTAWSGLRGRAGLLPPVDSGSLMTSGVGGSQKCKMTDCQGCYIHGETEVCREQTQAAGHPVCSGKLGDCMAGNCCPPGPGRPLTWEKSEV